MLQRKQKLMKNVQSRLPELIRGKGEAEEDAQNAFEPKALNKSSYLELNESSSKNIVPDTSFQF